MDLALRNNMISIEKNIVTLTDKGQKFTERALEFIITNKTSEIELMKEDFFLFRG